MDELQLLADLRARDLSLDMLRRARDVAHRRLYELTLTDPTGEATVHAGRLLKAFTIVAGEREAQLEAEVSALLATFDPDQWLR